MRRKSNFRSVGGTIFLLCLYNFAFTQLRGVSLVSPTDKVDGSWVLPIKEVNAEWVAIQPYAFNSLNDPKLLYNFSGQWWGEGKEGVIALVEQAHRNGLKVMLKPMIWVPESWPGGIDFKQEGDWQKWEAAYETYILDMLSIAIAEKVELFCIGTELKIFSAKREAFWFSLIEKCRSRYSGKLIYAANWDEYEHIKFWGSLDYIGIDAYFPLSDATTPTISTLKQALNTLSFKLSLLAFQFNKRVLFTEFGYRSVNGCAGKQWELESIGFSSQVNLIAQYNSYKAFFDCFWKEQWVAGGFIWQWYTNHEKAGGLKNSDYTPQNKPVESLIRTRFGLR